MPKVTIWIRKEDEDKWKAIENKPEWLHDHLNQKTVKFNQYADPNPTYDKESALPARIQLDRLNKARQLSEPTITPAEESHQTFFKNKKK